MQDGHGICRDLVPTQGQLDVTTPEISNPNTGGYPRGVSEYERLADAIALDRDSAMRSVLWASARPSGSAPDIWVVLRSGDAPKAGA